MWGGKTQKRKIDTIDNLIGMSTEVQGDIYFSGVLHIDGVVRGNVKTQEGGQNCVLAISESGAVHGEIHVPNLILNGTVHGDVYCSEALELAPKAKVMGNVYYNLLEIKLGAEINGKFVHVTEIDPATKGAPILASPMAKSSASLPAPKPDKPALPDKPAQPNKPVLAGDKVDKPAADKPS